MAIASLGFWKSSSSCSLAIARVRARVLGSDARAFDLISGFGSEINVCLKMAEVFELISSEGEEKGGIWTPPVSSIYLCVTKIFGRPFSVERLTDGLPPKSIFKSDEATMGHHYSGP